MTINYRINRSFITAKGVNQINGTLLYQIDATPVNITIIARNAYNARNVLNVMVN
jgi:hypothetical protein